MEHHHPPDEQLMQRVAQREQDALATLVSRHQLTAASLAHRLVHDHQTAEDIVQNAFLRLWTHAHHFQPTARFTTWFYRIIVNGALDHLRRQRRLRFLPFTPAASSSTVETASPDDLTERQARIRRAVAALPDRQRIALVLHRYHDLPHQQIAEITGWSPSAVESCIVRAYQTLRKTLADLAPP